MIANASDVKACLERVLALMAERDKINEGIADVIDEYKPKGVLGKGIRRVATLRRMDPNKRRSDEQLYTDYEDALGTLPEAVELVRAGKTYDEAAEATGLSKATVARMVKAAREVSNGRENETPARDPETGEIHTGEADLLEADAGRLGQLSDPAVDHVAVNPDPPLGRVSPHDRSGQGTQPGTHSETADLDTPPGGDQGTADVTTAQPEVAANPSEDQGERAGPLGASGNGCTGTLTNGTPAASIPAAPTCAKIAHVEGDPAIEAMLAANANLQSLKREKGME